jgi:hypothetical protein
MSNIRLTPRGYRVAAWTALAMFLLMLGVAGAVEGI